MSTASYSSKAMVDDDTNKVVSPLPSASTAAKDQKESDMVMVTDDDQKLEKDVSQAEIAESSSKAKYGADNQPMNRTRSTDFATMFMNSFKKYSTSTSGSVPLSDKKPAVDADTSTNVKYAPISLQENPQVESKVEAGSKKDTPRASLLVAEKDSNIFPGREVKEHSVVSLLSFPNDGMANLTMDISPGIPTSTGQPSPVNLDRDGDVVTVASQTMEIPSADGELSGSVLSFRVDDAVSTMSDELLQTMEEESMPQVVDTRPVDQVQGYIDVSPPCQAFSVSARTEASQQGVTPEGVEAMAGELGLDSFMMVGENLMRRSLVSEVLRDETQLGGSYKKVRRVAGTVVFVLVLLAMAFTMQHLPENAFTTSFYKINDIFASARKICMKVFREQTDDNGGQEILMVGKGDKGYLTEVLFGHGAGLPGVIDDGEEEQVFISSLLNTSIWADAAPPSPPSIAASTRDRVVQIAFNGLKMPEWTQALTARATVQRLVDMEYSGQCVSGFRNAVDFASSLSMFCQVLFGWTLLSFLVGLAVCFTLLMQRFKSGESGVVDGGMLAPKDVKIPKKEKDAIPKAEKNEIHEQDGEAFHVTVDLSKYKVLRKDVLKSILKDRSCRTGGVKRELIHRLVEDYHNELSGFEYRALQRRLKKQGLKATGKRGDLISRLLEAGLEKDI